MMTAPRQFLAGVLQRGTDDVDHLAEDGAVGDERRGDLDDGLAAVIEPRDQAALLQLGRQVVPQQPVCLLPR